MNFVTKLGSGPKVVVVVVVCGGFFGGRGVMYLGLGIV